MWHYLMGNRKVMAKSVLCPQPGPGYHVGTCDWPSHAVSAVLFPGGHAKYGLDYVVSVAEPYSSVNFVGRNMCNLGEGTQGAVLSSSPDLTLCFETGFH